MSTRRQLERVIVRQAICESAAFDQAEFLQRELDEQRHQLVELAKERAALLAENTKLRRAIRLILAGASTRDMRRKMKAIAEGVMGK